MKGRFRLTKAAKILIVILVIAVLAGVGFTAIKTGIVKLKEDDKKSEKTVNYDENGNVMNTDKKDENTINLSLDEWIGWKSIIDANGGLTTQPGSIYNDLGINVNISVINDATQSSNALIKGSLDAAGYTINRTAFLSQKFKDSGKEVIMPFITNYSNGGDGIIAKSNINTVEDLVNAKIGVPQFSEAHTLVLWFVQQSDLTEDQKNQIINNLIMFETPDETAKAFFAGEIDVAATWEPYLTDAKNSSDAHVFFSTASSSSLVMDGILFDKEFCQKNTDVVNNFIKGALMASEKYDTEFEAIKNVMPMYSTQTDDAIVENTKNAKLTTWYDNKNLLNGTAKTIYSDMCDIWESIGETVDKDAVNSIFDDTYINNLEGDFDSTQTSLETTATVTNENEQEIIDAEALLKKSATVNFIINTSKFTDTKEASKTLDDFIEVAKVLDGTIIEIAGNTDPNPETDPEDKYNIKLSKSRADAVKKYFIMNGIDAGRIVTVGNGSSKPVAPNDTEKNKAKNRRTDVSFKVIEK